VRALRIAGFRVARVMEPCSGHAVRQGSSGGGGGSSSTGSGLASPGSLLGRAGVDSSDTPGGSGARVLGFGAGNSGGDGILGPILVDILVGGAALTSPHLALLTIGSALMRILCSPVAALIPLTAPFPFHQRPCPHPPALRTPLHTVGPALNVWHLARHRGPRLR